MLLEYKRTVKVGELAQLPAPQGVVVAVMDDNTVPFDYGGYDLAGANVTCRLILACYMKKRLNSSYSSSS